LRASAREGALPLLTTTSSGSNDNDFHENNFLSCSLPISMSSSALLCPVVFGVALVFWVGSSSRVSLLGVCFALALVKSRYWSNIHDKAWEQTPYPFHVLTHSTCLTVPLSLFCKNKTQRGLRPTPYTGQSHVNTNKRGWVDNVRSCNPRYIKGAD
jgi:hypothetical protein